MGFESCRATTFSDRWDFLGVTTDFLSGPMRPRVSAHGRRDAFSQRISTSPVSFVRTAERVAYASGRIVQSNQQSENTPVEVLSMRNSDSTRTQRGAAP